MTVSLMLFILFWKETVEQRIREELYNMSQRLRNELMHEDVLLNSCICYLYANEATKSMITLFEFKRLVFRYPWIAKQELKKCYSRMISKLNALAWTIKCLTMNCEARMLYSLIKLYAGVWCLIGCVRRNIVRFLSYKH